MPAQHQFDANLLRAYDVNGPRYTSYPTALQFSEAFPVAAYGEAVRALPAQAPVSLYMHVPFCDTICYYCACNKIITNNRAHAERYLTRLCAEMSLHRANLRHDHVVEQLHFGGGTPTYLTNAQFETLFAALRSNFNLHDGAGRDYSIEIDPRTVDPARIAFLAELGLNRLSLGIQDFDPDVQRAVNRLQSEDDTAAVMRAARDNGFGSISVDLIYGLPLQTPERFRATLERVVRLAPDRLSIYSYAHLPQRFKTQRQIRDVDVPGPDTRLALLTTAIDTLTEAGYAYIGMDHFARPGDPLTCAQAGGTLHRNFQGYTTHGQCDLIGMGVSAISAVNGVYCQNAKTLDAYNASVDTGTLPIDRGIVLSDDDIIVRDAIQTLMCSFMLDIAAFEARHDIRFERYFAYALEQLAGMAADGLVSIDQDAIRVTGKGRFLIRNVCMSFDRYLPAASERRFSRAI